MKKLAIIMISAVMAMTFTVSASSADLSGVLPAVNAGEAVPDYSYDNYLTELVIPDEMKIEFDLTVNGPINPYATVFCFHNGDGNARFCFTLGGGLFYNDWAGNWFDAGLHDGHYDNIFAPYIGSTVKVTIIVAYDYFGVYLNDTYAYGSDTLSSRHNATDAFYGSQSFSDYWGISLFTCQSTTLDFGYNSWWTNATLDAVNAEIADFSVYFDDDLMAKYFVGGVAGENEFYKASDYETELVSTDTEAVTTDTPETDTPTETTAAPETDDSENESGCGSSLASVSIAAVFISIFGVAVIKHN